MGWSLSQKCEEVARRLPGKLSPEVRAQFVGLISPSSLAFALVAFAVSNVFGVGELVALGAFMVLGEQVLFELAHAVQIIALAETTAELDEAANHLASAVVMVGVAVFAAALAKVARSTRARQAPKEEAVTIKPRSANEPAAVGSGNSAGKSGSAINIDKAELPVEPGVSANVLKEAPPAAEAKIHEVTAKLMDITRQASVNVDKGIFSDDNVAAVRLAKMQPDNPLYKLTRGNAIHQEVENLITEAQDSGELSRKIVFNTGVALGPEMPNNYRTSGRTLRPDIRLPIGNGQEAVWDITTDGQAGHAVKYDFPHTQSIIEIYYPPKR